MKKNELQNKRFALIAALETLVSEMGEKPTEEQETRFSTIQEEIKTLDTSIKRATEVEELRKAAAATGAAVGEGEKEELKKINKRYSILTAVRSQLINGKLEGLEAEMHQLAVQESRANGTTINGLGIPSALFKVQKRDMTAGTTTAGGHTVQTDIGEIIPFLYPKMRVIELGATVFTDLVGNVKFPRNDAAATGTWEGETDANAESSPTFDSITLSPKRVGTYVDASKQLLLQSSASIENWIIQQLNTAIGQAGDVAAINGSGSGGQPTGILNTSGIGDVAGGTNGAAPTWAHILELESDIAAANADVMNMAYLTTPGVRGKLKQTEKATNTAQFVWTGMEVNGYRAEVSTNVPSNLTKGSGTNLHAIIFANWQELYLGNWGGIDLVIDPYSQAINGLVRIVANSFWDVQLRHAQSFAAMKDAVV